MGNYLLRGFESLPLRHDGPRRASLGPRGATVSARVLLLLAVLAFLPGCLGARSRAERVELERSPVRDARAGQVARYRGERTGEPGGPVTEEWTFSVRSVEGGYARVEVAVLGPPRVPASPSPREPGYVLDVPTKDDGFTGVEILRLFRHPELTTHGVRSLLDRGKVSVEGDGDSLPYLFAGKTHPAHALTLRISDERLRSAVYRVVVLDDLPVLGVVEADLDEVWVSLTPDGEEREERRHDHLALLP